MRAARTQRRRTTWQIVAHLGMLGGLSAEGDCNGARGKLAIGAQRTFGLGKLHAQGAHAFAQIIAALFDNVHVFDGSGEFTNLLRRKRPRHAKLQDVGLRQRLAHVLVGRTAANNADCALVALNAVEFARFGILGHSSHTRIERHAARLGVCGHHDPLRSIFCIGLRLNLHTLAQFNGTFRMRHAHRGANHARHIEALGHLEGVFGEGKRFGRIGGIEHGNMRGAGIKARILLILRGVHARVIGRENHETAVDARVGSGEQGVGGHVDAHVLHAREHAAASGACAQANFHGDFLIRAPFGIYAGLLRERFHGFGRRRAGVCHANSGASLPRAARNRLVAGNKLHKSNPPWVVQKLAFAIRKRPARRAHGRLAHGWRSQIHQAERANLNNVAIAQVSVFHIEVVYPQAIERVGVANAEASQRALNGRMHARNRHVV